MAKHSSEDDGRKLTQIIGAPHEGKSTLSYKIANTYLRERKGDFALWVGIKPPNKKINKVAHYITWDEFQAGKLKPGKINFLMVPELGLDPREDAELFLSIIKYKNGLVIFDDAGNYLTGALTKEGKGMISLKNQWELDFIVQYHGIPEAPPSMWRYTNNLILFKTSDEPHRKAMSTPHFDLIYDTYKEMQNSPKHSYKIVKILKYGN